VLLSSPEGQQAGLLSDSVIMTDNLATIAASAIDRAIGSFPMRQIDAALAHTLGLTIAAAPPAPSAPQP
jgi:mRNA interferase MazF